MPSSCSGRSNGGGQGGIFKPSSFGSMIHLQCSGSRAAHQAAAAGRPILTSASAPKNRRTTCEATPRPAASIGDCIERAALAQLGSRLSLCHIADMATYTIIPRSGGNGYDIGVVGADGVRQTMLGYKTEAAAQEWIAHDQALSDRPRVIHPAMRRGRVASGIHLMAKRAS